MREKKGGMNRAHVKQGELSSGSNIMMHIIDSLYVDMQPECIGRDYKLLNPGQTFKKIGIIQEIMRIIVLVQLNMLPVTWLHKTSLPQAGHDPTKALLMLLETYQSWLARHIGRELPVASP
jgi:hypothetical protein